MSLGILFAGALTLQLFAGAEQEENASRQQQEKAAPAARQNTVLRSYFRSRYLTFYRPERDMNSEFVENFVDRQIDAFLEDIQEKIERLEDSYEVAQHLARRLEGTPAGEARRRDVLKAFAAALKEVGDSADSLGDRLWPIFEGLDRKKKLESAESLPDLNQTTASGMDFMAQQISIATKRIRDYLFLSNNTVSLDDLNGTNMLVRLYWAEQLAKRLKKTLK